MDIRTLTIPQIRAGLAAREFSASELAEEALRFAHIENPKTNAYLTFSSERALEAARSVDRRLARGEEPGALAGVPVAVKDVIVTQGLRTTCGSKLLEKFIPPYDATAVERLEAAGGVVIGKTNCDEFAMGSSTENSAYGPTHNPWDPTRVPGGSGGGSAAAVSAGLAPWALGSDTGGSIKQPASLCGVVGLRPTYGTVSRYGIIAFASSLDQVGPITKTVRDCALLYRIIAGRDRLDSTTVELPGPVELPQARDLKGMRIGLPREMNEAEGIAPGVKAEAEKAIELCRELGAEVEECSLPLSIEYGLACYYLIAPAEASSNLARYDGVRYGHRAKGASSLIEPLYMVAIQLKTLIALGTATRKVRSEKTMSAVSL